MRRLSAVLIPSLALGLAFVTRTPMLFMCPLFLLEAWRAGRAGLVRRDARLDLAPYPIPSFALNEASSRTRQIQASRT